MRLTVTDRAPRVSLLIPVHDQEGFLDETMRSALSQTYDDYEVVVLDDGSTDASLQVLRRYEGDPRLTVLTQANVGRDGLHVPFNRLVTSARGELLAWLGGDDAALPERLSAQVAVFDEDPGVDVCHSAGWLMDAASRPLGGTWQLERGYDELSAPRDMLAGNLVAHPSVMMRRSAHDRVGPFEEGVGCDYHLWLKSAGSLRFRYLPRRLVRYRIHDRSLSTSATGAPHAMAEARRVRALLMRDRPLSDFFPELGAADDPRACLEAGLALGNSLAQQDPDAALVAYDMAAAAVPGAEVEHNRAIAHLLRGDAGAAAAHAEAAAALDPASEVLADAARGTYRGEVTLRAPRAVLDATLARARTGTGVHRWDGTATSTARAYVGLPVADDELSRTTVAAWCASTRPSTGARWTIPTLGEGAEHLFERVATAAAGMDLSLAGDVTLEEVDDLALLPPEAGRPTAVLADLDGVAAFHAWATSLARESLLEADLSA